MGVCLVSPYTECRTFVPLQMSHNPFLVLLFCSPPRYFQSEYKYIGSGSSFAGPYIPYSLPHNGLKYSCMAMILRNWLPGVMRHMSVMKRLQILRYSSRCLTSATLYDASQRTSKAHKFPFPAIARHVQCLVVP